jgi:hypothetical protein
MNIKGRDGRTRKRMNIKMKDWHGMKIRIGDRVELNDPKTALSPRKSAVPSFLSQFILDTQYSPLSLLYSLFFISFKIDQLRVDEGTLSQFSIQSRKLILDAIRDRCLISLRGSARYC